MTRDSYDILMYSHDTYGLGHIRRTMAIASQLQQKNVNILILTGSPLVGRFDFPQGIDFVRVPGMIKKENDLYLPHSIRLTAAHAVDIRQSIITATAKAFQPDLFIVDKAPLGLKREIVQTLKWLKRCKHDCKTVLGLRDIMDDAKSTIKDWRSKRIYHYLEKYYSEIWVYGHQDLYDPVKEYNIPESISSKMVFTGYIPRLSKPCVNGNGNGNGNGHCLSRSILVTAGGGGDGYPLMDEFLKLIENKGLPSDIKITMVTGPFMPKSMRTEIGRRAKAQGVRFYHFFRRMERLIAQSDLVVSMGGYNTVSEILSAGKLSLIVPRDTPRLEQTIRADVFSKNGIAGTISWKDLSADSLEKKILSMLDNPDSYLDAVNNFRFTGLDVMRERIATFRSEIK